MAIKNDFFDYIKGGSYAFDYMWNGQRRTCDLALQAVLPSLETVMRLSYAEQCQYFRWLVRVNPTLNQVHSRFIRLLGGRKLVLTGSERTVKEVEESVYDSFDNGDGWKAFNRRLMSDYITCGQGAAKIIWDGGRVVSAESLDAAFLHKNTGGNDKRPPDIYPYIYRGVGQPYYLERRDRAQEFFILSSAEASRRDSEMGINNAVHSPLIGQYAEIVADHNERVIEYAHQTGNAVWQLVFMPSGFTQNTRDAQAVDKSTGDDRPGMPGSLLVEVMDDANKVKSIEILRNIPSSEILARRQARLKAFCNSPYAINPILVDPSLSGTNSLSDGTKSREVGDLHAGDLPTILHEELAELLMRYVTPRRRVQVSFEFENPRRDAGRISTFISAVQAGAAATGEPVITRDEFRKALNLFGAVPAGIIAEQGDIITVASDENADIVTGDGGPVGVDDLEYDEGVEVAIAKSYLPDDPLLKT